MKNTIYDWIWILFMVAAFTFVALCPAVFVYCFVKLSWLLLKWIASQPW